MWHSTRCTRPQYDNSTSHVARCTLSAAQTAIVENAALIVDRAVIRSRYLRRWFAIDLVGSFPLDLVLRVLRGGDPGEDTQFITIVKVLKAPKLLRVGRILKKLEKVEGGTNIGSIVVLCIIMVIMVHWISCVWFLFTSAMGEAGWLASTAGLSEEPWTEQYAATFYTTLMMVMGDAIEIANDGELMVASTIVIMGVCINATIFASVTMYVSQLSERAQQHKQRMSWIQHALKRHGGLSEIGLDDRILRYYEASSEHELSEPAH